MTALHSVHMHITVCTCTLTVCTFSLKKKIEYCPSEIKVIMYQFVNLMQLVSVSLYFKTLVNLRNLKEGDEFDISIHFSIQKSHVLFFINVLQHAKPHLYRLIMP